MKRCCDLFRIDFFSNWTANKKDGEIRATIDYRELNKVTKRPFYPIPDIQELLDCLYGMIF